MTLRKVDWLFVLFSVAEVIDVSLLLTPKDLNPMILSTSEHRSSTNENSCAQCHLADGVNPVPAHHPTR
jgi:cytochrome c553